MSAVSYMVTDRIADIVVARPPVNALDLATIRDLIGAVRRAGSDAGVDAVVISSGLPKVFFAGLDLDDMLGKETSQVHELLTTLYVELHEAQLQMGKPSIAAVEGAARGAGMTVAISCDVIVCGERASFGYPEIDVGLIPGIHFVHLPRIIGRHRAFELLFSGRKFDAAEAAALGLVSQVLPQERVLDEARSLARVFAAKSPQVMRLAKAAFTRAVEMDYRRSVADVVEAFCVIAATNDAQEGLRAFSEKRKPAWAPRQR